MAYNNYNEKGYKQLAGYSKTPAPDVIVQSPTYVICNKVGTYSFSYPDGTTGDGSSSFIQGAKVVNAGGPIKLDINPVKWTAAGGAAGDVIFVYRRMG